MTLITQTTYIDNFDSEIQGAIEIGVRDKKAFILLGTQKVYNKDNIKGLEKYQAFKIALNVAKDYYSCSFNKRKIVDKEIEDLFV